LLEDRLQDLRACHLRSQPACKVELVPEVLDSCARTRRESSICNGFLNGCSMPHLATTPDTFLQCITSRLEDVAVDPLMLWVET